MRSHVIKSAFEIRSKLDVATASTLLLELGLRVAIRSVQRVLHAIRIVGEICACLDRYLSLSVPQT